MHHQGHVYHAVSCTRRPESPLDAEQACKGILPLKLHVDRPSAIAWAHKSHLAAVSNDDATRSTTRCEQAGTVVNASSCSPAQHISIPICGLDHLSTQRDMLLDIIPTNISHISLLQKLTTYIELSARQIKNADFVAQRPHISTVLVGGR